MKAKEFINELNKKEIAKLKQEMAKQQVKLQELRSDLGFGKLKNYKNINETKKNIARIHTVLNNKVEDVVEQANDNASKETSHGQD